MNKKAFIKQCEKMFDENTKIKIKPRSPRYKNVPHPFSVKQLKRIFSVIDNGKMGMICFLALYFGMRRGEVITLKISNIHWDTGIIRQMNTKNGQPATFQGDPVVMKLLRKWVSLLPDTQWVFPSEASKEEHVTLNGFSFEYSKVLKKAGLYDEYIRSTTDGRRLHKYRFHTFRATYGSLLANNGIDVMVTKDLMRHSKIETTMKYYIHVGSPVKREAMSRVFGRNTAKVNKLLQTEDSFSQSLNEAKEKVFKQPVEQIENDIKSPYLLLQQRLAKGDINPEDYKTRIEILQSTEEKKGSDDYIG